MEAVRHPRRRPPARACRIVALRLHVRRHRLGALFLLKPATPRQRLDVAGAAPSRAHHHLCSWPAAAVASLFSSVTSDPPIRR